MRDDTWFVDADPDLPPNLECDFEVPDASDAPSPALRKHALPGVLLCAPEDIADLIVALRPVPPKSDLLRPELFPGKRFSLAPDGRLVPGKDLPFNRGRWFRALAYGFGDIEGLHAAFERLRLGTDTGGAAAYAVPGQPAGGVDVRSMPRTKSAKAAVRGDGGRLEKQGAPRGLVDERRLWLVADMDKIPNVEGHDPRHGPGAAEAAVAWLRGLLPPAARDTRWSWQLSASCCVKGEDGRPLPHDMAPPTLGAHLRCVLDEALDEGERAALLEGLRLAILAELGRRGIVASPALRAVDPATAVFNQPIFVCASYEGGLADPIPGDCRSGLFAEGAPVLSAAALRAELPSLSVEEPRTRRRSPPEHNALCASTGQVRAKPTADDRLIPAAAPPREQDAAVDASVWPEREPPPIALVQQYFPAERGRAAAVYRRQITGWGRGLGDVLRIVDHRRAKDPAWGQGVPEGMRTLLMTQVAAALAHLVPPQQLRGAIRAYALRLTTEAWFEAEWVAEAKDARILRDAELAAAAARAGHAYLPGQIMSPYKSRFMALLRPTEQEQRYLGLESLRDEAARSRTRRREKGAMPVEVYRVRRARNSEKARQPWVAEGISESTYRRRRRAAKAAAFARALDPATAMLSAAGLADVVAVLHLSVDPNSRQAARQLAAGPCRGLGLVRLAEARLPIHEGLAWRASGGTAAEDQAAALSRTLSALAAAAQAGIRSEEMLRYVLEDMRYLEWAAQWRQKEPPVVAVTTLLSLAAANPSVRDFLAAVQRLERGETGLTVDATVVHGEEEGQGGTGEMPARAALTYPGAAVAGCSRATWFRRRRAERVRAAETQLTVDATPIHGEGEAERGVGQVQAEAWEDTDEIKYPW